MVQQISNEGLGGFDTGGHKDMQAQLWDTEKLYGAIGGIHVLDGWGNREQRRYVTIGFSYRPGQDRLLSCGRLRLSEEEQGRKTTNKSGNKQGQGIGVGHGAVRSSSSHPTLYFYSKRRYQEKLIEAFESIISARCSSSVLAPEEAAFVRIIMASLIMA